jgi:hypothetical protein
MTALFWNSQQGGGTGLLNEQPFPTLSRVRDEAADNSISNPGYMSSIMPLMNSASVFSIKKCLKGS